MVVAADRWCSTSRAIEFAQFARNIGADVVMAQPPNWGPSCTPQTLADHYRAVSEQLPVMIVTNVFSAQGADFGLETVRLTLDQCPDVVAIKDDLCGDFARRLCLLAIKDDLCGDFARRLCLLAHERCAVFAGGQKVNHMDMWPYGCDGYLSTFMSFRPDIAYQYWSAIEARDLEAARAIIRDYDMPFFDFISGFTGGWNAGLHGTLEVFGIAKRWRRKPYYSLDDAEMEKLREFLKGKRILR
jgi:dihydrodipicolinate synthase/N-acetylneuraminate lyase